MPTQAPVSVHLDLYSYWLSKRGARTMAARTNINPADIPQLLPYIMIVERAGDQFRYRLVGSAIVRSVGYDATGATVGSYLVTPEATAEARAVFGRVFTAACPVFATGGFFFKTRAHLNMSMLTLPLSEDGTVVNQSISTLAARLGGLLKETPGWLKGLSIEVRDVLDVKDAAELVMFCREWEKRSAALTEEQPLPD